MYKHVRLNASSRSVSRALRRYRKWQSTGHSTDDLSILAIETSCDDSSVAILNLKRSPSTPRNVWHSEVAFHKTVTAQTQQYNGIHPIVALSSHHAELSKLVQSAVKQQKAVDATWTRPSLVAATRGPGMRSNLAVGLSVAKGLAIAWDVPFVGVHHMQAHALTPRLCWTLDQRAQDQSQQWGDWTLENLEPRFPYLSILVSGGHTMLLQSNGLTEHRILAETADIALGDCLDKAARAIIPSALCTPPYGKALEEFAFPNGPADYKYVAPTNRAEEIAMRNTPYAWSLRPPLQESRKMQFSYAGLLSMVERLMQTEPSTLHHSQDDIGNGRTMMTEDERRYLAREVLRVCFEHLASRIFLHLTTSGAARHVDTIVVSGGVASNGFLRHALREMLQARGFARIQLAFPPAKLCIDNALMIAWAGWEMYQQGFTTDLDVEPIRKWSMDSTQQDGGVLGAPGWHRDHSKLLCH